MKYLFRLSAFLCFVFVLSVTPDFRIMKPLPLLACLGLLGTAFAAEPPAYPFASIPVASGVTIPGLPKLNGLIRVDQFGYRPDAVKVAVLASPRRGYNSFLTYTPSEQLELCRADDGRTVFTAIEKQDTPGGQGPYVAF